MLNECRMELDVLLVGAVFYCTSLHLHKYSTLPSVNAVLPLSYSIILVTQYFFALLISFFNMARSRGCAKRAFFSRFIISARIN